MTFIKIHLTRHTTAAGFWRLATFREFQFPRQLPIVELRCLCEKRLCLKSVLVCSAVHRFLSQQWHRKTRVSIAVITVEPTEKIPFVYNCMQRRLRGQYNGKWPITLVCVSRPLVTVITAIIRLLYFVLECKSGRDTVWSLSRTQRLVLLPRERVNKSCVLFMTFFIKRIVPHSFTLTDKSDIVWRKVCLEQQNRASQAPQASKHGNLRYIICTIHNILFSVWNDGCCKL